MAKQPMISDSNTIQTRVDYINAGRSALATIQYREFPHGTWHPMPMRPEPRWKAQDRARAAFPNALHAD